jgi:hypothetical protein
MTYTDEEALKAARKAFERNAQIKESLLHAIAIRDEENLLRLLKSILDDLRLPVTDVVAFAQRLFKQRETNSVPSPYRQMEQPSDSYR